MKKRTFKILIVIAIIILCSCSKTKKEYYETGEVKWILASTKIDSVKYFTEYYRNGNVKSEGALINEKLQDGEWKEYFSDGVLRWRGTYEDGCRIIANNSDEMLLWNKKTIKVEVARKRNIKVGDEINFRLLLDSVHPSCYAVTVSDTLNICTVVACDEDVAYPYKLEIIPQYIFSKDSVIKVVVFFPNEDGEIVVGGKYYKEVEIPLEESEYCVYTLTKE